MITRLTLGINSRLTPLEATPKGMLAWPPSLKKLDSKERLKRLNDLATRISPHPFEDDASPYQDTADELCGMIGIDRDRSKHTEQDRGNYARTLGRLILFAVDPEALESSADTYVTRRSAADVAATQWVGKLLKRSEHELQESTVHRAGLVLPPAVKEAVLDPNLESEAYVYTGVVKQIALEGMITPPGGSLPPSPTRPFPPLIVSHSSVGHTMRILERLPTRPFSPLIVHGHSSVGQTLRILERLLHEGRDTVVTHDKQGRIAITTVPPRAASVTNPTPAK